ncbi:aldo/keto reductase [Streptomyces luteolus]|uniref:Aldo/keto reductase n=1 Tax=Streptomyces luteolus TaxID=3043615 RepID=A0ABT6SZI2_9ACTN|nr:aldo/keto reductase [Streptomyces sp. B-S-A12]MDI3420595.1 aldo/keto reductase [Streptomyces sp. B-S-A12]
MGSVSASERTVTHRAAGCADLVPDRLGARLRRAAADVLAGCAAALRAEGHPFVQLPELWRDTRAQLALAVAECSRALDAPGLSQAGGHPDHVRGTEVSFRALGARWAAVDLGLADCLAALDRLTEALVATVEEAGRETGDAGAADIARRVFARCTRAAAHGYATRLRAHRPAPGDDCCGRMARDVHDHLGGSLALAFRHLELHRLKTPSADADARGTDRHLAAVHDALREAITLTRGLVTGLRDTDGSTSPTAAASSASPTYQGYYNLGARELEHEIVPAAADQGVGITVWSPLAGGFFSGKYRRRQDVSADFRLAHEGPASIAPLTDREQAYDVVEVLDGIARERGVSIAQVALNWVLSKPAVTSVVFGASRPGQLQDNLGTVEWEITAEERERLDAASDRPAPYPYWHMRAIAGDRDLPGDILP